MASEPTHRDLYVMAVQRVSVHPERDRPLEAYLSAMLGLVRALHDRPELRASEFLDLVVGPLGAPAIPFEPAWDTLPAAVPIGGATADDVLATLARQIAELRRLAEAGVLSAAAREFGIDAPRGGRWTNFTPASFVECGLQGAFGGLALDESSRSLTMGGPRRAEQSGIMPARAVPMSWVTWDDVISFLICGQCHE
jgi:hypothetical protein